MFAILVGLACLASVVVFALGERVIGGVWFGYNIVVLFTARHFAGTFGFFWYVVILGGLVFLAMLMQAISNKR